MFYKTNTTIYTRDSILHIYIWISHRFWFIAFMNFMPKKIHQFLLKWFPLQKLSFKFEGNLGLYTWVTASFWQKSYIINFGWQFQKDYAVFFSQTSIQYISPEHLYSFFSRSCLFFSLFKNIQKIQFLVNIEFPKFNILIKL